MTDAPETDAREIDASSDTWWLLLLWEELARDGFDFPVEAMTADPGQQADLTGLRAACGRLRLAHLAELVPAGG